MISEQNTDKELVLTKKEPSSKVNGSMDNSLVQINSSIEKTVAHGLDPL